MRAAKSAPLALSPLAAPSNSGARHATAQASARVFPRLGVMGAPATAQEVSHRRVSKGWKDLVNRLLRAALEFDSSQSVSSLGKLGMRKNKTPHPEPVEG